MIKRYVLLCSLILLAAAQACSPDDTEKQGNASQNKDLAPASDSLIPFPGTQQAPDNNEITSLQKKEMTKRIQCQGMVRAHPNDMAVVAAPMKGFVRHLNHQKGEQVKQGEVVAELSHPGYLELQQQYLSAKSYMEYYRQEYKRQGELAVDEAAPLKKVQKAKASFQDHQAKLSALEQQLKMLHIDPKQLSDGNLVSTISIPAPINGTISEMGVCHGTLAHEDTFICKIINQRRNRLRIKIHERYSKQINTQQKITFQPHFDDSRTFTTHVKQIGSMMDPTSHSLHIYAPLAHLDETFKHGSRVKASVNLGRHTLDALPADALADIQGKPHVLVITEKGYLPAPVTTGTLQEGFIPIRNTDALAGKNVARHASRILKENYPSSSSNPVQ